MSRTNVVTRTRFAVAPGGTVSWLAVLADGIVYAATAPSLTAAVVALLDAVERHPTAPTEAPAEE
jgi:hypothetical protein